MNADDPKLGFDTRETVKGVENAESALDSLVKKLQALDRSIASSATQAKGNTDKLNQALNSLNGSMSRKLTESWQAALTSLSTGTANALKLTKDLDQGLQGAFEARLLSVSKMTNEELRIWREFGVKLNGLQKAQLKGYSPDVLGNFDSSSASQRLYAKAGMLAKDDSPLKSIRATVAGDSDYILARLTKHYADQERILGNIVQTKQAGVSSSLTSIRKATEVDSAAILAEMSAFYQKQQSLGKVYSKAGALGLDNSPLKSIRVSTEADSGLILASMGKFYADQERILNNIARKDYPFSPLSSIRKQTELDSAAILSSLSKFYAQQQRFASVKSGSGVSIGNTSYSTEDRSKATLSGMSAYYSALQSGKTAAQAMEAANVPVAASMDQVAVRAKQSAAGLNIFKTQANDVHSAMRGLASGFNLLWLTWGNLGPLFIGAAISNSFMQVAKTGMALEHTLAIIGHVGGASAREVDKLRVAVFELGRTGPFGPLEIAEAMKMLSLAGLEANQILSVTQDVLNFSVAGTTDIKTAAETLMAVSTAFSMGAKGFGQVSDVISKAAAESMTSVEAFSGAMKTASVINAQYGVSLEDTATGIAALANLGIQASAAGTSLRNAYADLSGRSMQVANVLRKQGIELRDTTGAFKPMLTVVDELNKKFMTLDGIGQKNLMQALLSERGAKSIVELLRLIRTEAKDMGSGLGNALEEMRNNIGDSAGFAAITAARMAQTAENQFKSMKASFSTGLAEAFKQMEPSLLLITNRMREAFSSPEFQSGIAALVSGVANFVVVLATNVKVLTVAAVAYGSLKIAAMAIIPILQIYEKLKTKETAATIANTVAIEAETAAKRRSITAGAAVMTGMGRLAAAVPVLGTAIGLLTAGWMAYEFFSTKASDNAAAASDESHRALVKNLTEQADKLAYVNALRAEGLDQQEAELRFQAFKEGGGSSGLRGKAAAQDALLQAAQEYQRAGETGSPQTRFDAKEKLVAAEREVLRILRQEKEVEEQIQRIKANTSWKNQLNNTEYQASRLAAEQAFLGDGTYQLGQDSGGSAAGRAEREAKKQANALSSLIEKHEEVKAARQAELNALMTGIPIQADELRRAKEKASALKELELRYTEVTDSVKENKDLSPAVKSATLGVLGAERAKTQALIEGNFQLGENIFTQERAQNTSKESAKAYLAEAEALAKLSETRRSAIRSAKEQNDSAEVALQRSRGTLGVSGYQLGLQNKLGDINLDYANRERGMKDGFYLSDPDGKNNMTMEQYKAAEDSMLADVGALNEERARALGIASSLAYQEAWNTAVTGISSKFVDQMMAGTLNLKEFMIESFADMVLKPQLNLMVQKGFEALLGGSGLFTSLLGFDGGGYTGNGSRTGGLDGKGGFLAMLHPKETVVDHHRGQSTQSAEAPIYVTINQTVGDIATKSMLADVQQATVQQVQAGLSRSMRYRGAMANG